MTDESVGDFTEVRLVADQPFAKNTTGFNISFEDISATGQCNININTMSLVGMLLPTPWELKIAIVGRNKQLNYSATPLNQRNLYNKDTIMFSSMVLKWLDNLRM